MKKKKDQYQSGLTFQTCDLSHETSITVLKKLRSSILNHSNIER
jgi:hypothetical protein